jgi:hypothetical protein
VIFDSKPEALLIFNHISGDDNFLQFSGNSVHFLKKYKISENDVELPESPIYFPETHKSVKFCGVGFPTNSTELHLLKGTCAQSAESSSHLVNFPMMSSEFSFIILVDT